MFGRNRRTANVDPDLGDNFNFLTPQDIGDVAFPAPHLAPFDPHVPQLRDADSVDPLAGIAPNGHLLPVQDSHVDLASLRGRYPFLPIIRFPPEIRYAVFDGTNINQPQNVYLGQAVLCMIKGNADFYVSAEGNAVVPTVANIGANRDQVAALYKPEGMFYTGGINQLSVISGAVGCVVCIAIYRPEEYPRAS